MGNAVFKQKNGLMGVVVVFACGVTAPEVLAKLSILAIDHGCSANKLTTRQTMVFLIPEDKVISFTQGVERLGLQVGGFDQVVRNVKACTGNKSLCPRSYGDALDLGIALQKKFMNQKAPKDFKISVAGCMRGCTDPLCADLGLIAKGNGLYDIYLGGRGGSKKPLHGKKILGDIQEDNITEVVEYILNKYREIGQEKERICLTIDRVGLSHFIPPINSEISNELSNKIKQQSKQSETTLEIYSASSNLDTMPNNEETTTNAFAKVVKALENCCNSQDCGSCAHQNCVVGYAKITTSFAKDNNTYVIPLDLQMIPKEDIKIYDQETINDALISTLLQCKECKDNHEHSCFINLVRLSLEIGLFGDNVPYDGTLFKYLIKVKEIAPELGDKLIFAYQESKKAMASI